MIHARSPNGSSSETSQAYDVHGRFIRAVDRGGLNKRILDELEDMPNVKIFFHHKMTGADFRRKKAWFEVRQSGEKTGSETRAREVEIDFALLLGADGAHSATRYHMMKFARTNYSQEYIDCLWCEFTIPPSLSGDFRISPNHLHIWPAGSFMFIAIPSLDKSFTCTLFGPADLFMKLEKDPQSELMKTFEKYFPGIVPDLLSLEDLQNQFGRNPHLPLINIKCAPHHFDDSVAILGDAANAIVPFYGQGMNAGLESVRILFSKLDTHHDRRAALSAYTSERVADAHSIADLALSNYIEMRSSVTSSLYKIRKYVEEKLDSYWPKLGWATRYSRISFGNERYSVVEAKSMRQQAILVALVGGLLTSAGAAVMYWILRWQQARRIREWLWKPADAR